MITTPPTIPRVALVLLEEVADEGRRRAQGHEDRGEAQHEEEARDRHAAREARAEPPSP